TIGFGLLYGMGPYKLSQRLGVTYEKAVEYMELFFKAYPGAHGWITQVHEDCLETGVVWTILNRPRRLNEIFSDESWVRARAKRQSVNSIIQGSAADVVLSAMLKVDMDEVLATLACILLLQVHDELVFEVPEDCVDEALPRVKTLMEYSREADDLEVDLTVSAHIGDNWKDAK
ncbi:MAG: DNA polymerase I, partial [Planctomycetes bacterium]|nr:DNA polymerase I [Planctomycetota bacterium]